MAALAGELGYPTARDVMATRLQIALDATDRDVFVAEVDGTVVGWIEFADRPSLYDGPSVEIEGLVVAGPHRGAGVGGSLVAVAERWALERDRGAVRVRSRSTRSDTHRFYLDLGYEEIKSQVVFRKRM